MKKLFSLAAIALTISSASFANEFPRYMISISDIKAYIHQANQFEQCIDPAVRKANGNLDEIKAIDSMRSPEFNALLQTYTTNIFKKIVGTQNYYTIANDKASYDYLQKLFKQYNNDNPVDFSKDWCDRMKANFNKDLKDGVGSYIK